MEVVTGQWRQLPDSGVYGQCASEGHVHRIIALHVQGPNLVQLKPYICNQYFLCLAGSCFILMCLLCANSIV